MATALGRPLIAQKLVEIAGDRAGARPLRTAARQRHAGRARPTRASAIACAPARTSSVIALPACRPAAATVAPVTARRQPVGPLDRLRRPRGPVDRAARGHLHADEAAPECPDEPAYVEIDVRARRADGDQRRGDAARRADRQPRHDRRRPRRRPHRPRRNRLVGLSRKVYEAPAAVVLHTAHKELTKLAASRDPERFARSGQRVQYADLDLQRPVVHAAARGARRLRRQGPGRVTGDVRLKLFKGDCRIVGRNVRRRRARRRRRRSAQPSSTAVQTD